MDTKRRHFERHKAGTMHEDDDDDSDGAETSASISSISRYRGAAACQVTTAAANRLAAPSQSLVTSKIGLFERLSNGGAETRARLSRQPELDDGLQLGADDDDDDDDGVEFDEVDVEEEEEEEFLVLDTIVEEDEETATCESAQVLTSTTTSCANDKLDCDKLAKLTTANINNNVPATAECGNFAANSQMTAANENNGRAPNSKLAPSTTEPSGGSTQQPPAETLRAQSQSSPTSLPQAQQPPSSSPPSSPSPSSLPPGNERSANHKAQNGDSGRDQQATEPVSDGRDEPEDSVELNSIRLMTETATTTTKTTTGETKSAAMTTNSQSRGAGLKGHVGEFANGAQCEKQQQEQVKSSCSSDNKTKTATNKMQYQTLLPSTNRLISEHQARQQQALFRALNERQKILDEMGAGEQLERPDLMSTSSMSLNLRSKRHWRKSANRAAAFSSRRRSNSANQQDQAGGSRRRQASRHDGGVPLSSVDLSSMTDQQVDEILGQIAPASSSSSMVSSRASLMDEFSSSSSSAASSTGDDSSSCTYSTDDDDDDDDDDDGHELNQDQLKSQMVRRIRRRLANDSNQLADHERDHAESTGGRQQQGLAPSVIGVHEDDTISVNSARRSLRSSARNCREAFKKRGKNGPSDDENDHEGDHQGDLFVSVAAPSGRDQQSGGLGQVGSNQCSLSPQAGQSQTTAAGGGSNNLLLASAVRNFAASNSHNSLSSSSVVLSQSQSPTTSDEHSSLINQQGQRADAQSVEATLSRMLKALDEVGQNHNQNDEQDELAELLERGFVHLEQLLECSQTSSSQTLPRSQQLQAPSQKDSDYGSDTQSNGECLSSSVSQSASGAAAAAGSQTSSSSLSPLAIELSLRLAELLRRLAQQQQLARRQPTQLEASTSATPELDVARGYESSQSAAPSEDRPAQRQPPLSTTTPRARMRSVVMINSGGSPSSGNVTPCELTSRPGSQQSQRQFKTRVNIISSPSSCEPTQANVSNADGGETQIIKVVATAGLNLGERVSRRTSFLGSSLRRRPSFSGSIASVHREPGAPRPGSPVPRSVLEMQAARAAKSSSESNQNMQAEQQHEQQQQQHQQQQQQQQQHRVQRALILAQKYNYSPAKLATSKLSAKLNLKELIGTGNNYAGGNQLGGSSSANRGGGDPELVQGKSVPPSRGGVQAKHIRGGDLTSGTALDVTGQVQLDISYFARTGSLTVHLLQCSGLAPVNKRRATSNPYVKLYLLPDRSRSGKRKSSVKRRQLNPNFGERFTFGPLQLHEFESRTLWLSVWHKDRGLGRNVSLGELHLPLSQIRKQLLTSDLCQSTSSCWYQLKIQERQTNDQTLLIRQPDGTPLTTKKLPLSNETTDTIKRLSDFEKRAARLAQQHNRLFAETEKLDQNQEQQTGAANRLKTSSTTEPTAGGRLMTGLQLNMDKPGQSPLKTMQVALGPVLANSGICSAECATISGQLFVALKFVPESAEALARQTSAQVSGSLHVLIKEARDIGGFKTGAAPPSDQLPSPFCKCILLDSSGQKVAKQKTHQLRRTNSPSWNQTLIFPKLKMATLQAQGLEIQLFNRDSILVSSSEHMGSIRLCKRMRDAAETAPGAHQRCDLDQSINMASISSSGSLKSSISSTSTNTLNTVDDDLCSEREARLWGQMLARPNIWVYGELPLRQLRPLVDLTTVIGRQQTNCSIDNK